MRKVFMECCGLLKVFHGVMWAAEGRVQLDILCPNIEKIINDYIFSKSFITIFH